jgi:hypothetical protein
LTAPVSGSGCWPACTARVEYLYWAMIREMLLGFLY